MALTQSERLVVGDILKTVADSSDIGQLADFADLTKAQQMAFLKNKVQNRRDKLQVAINDEPAASAARIVVMTADRAVLDGLLAKL